MTDLPLPRSWRFLVEALWFQRWPTDPQGWNTVTQTAKAQGLLDALAFAVYTFKPDLPPGVAQTLREARYNAEARYARTQAIIQDLGRLLREAGLQAVLFKGLVLAQAYPYPPARFFSDIDILLPGREAQERYVAALKAHGYREEPEAHEGESAQHYPKLFPPQTGLAVEVHRILGREGGFERPERTAEFWQAARPCPAFPDFLELDSIDHYLFLLYHALQAHLLELGVRTFYDFHRYTLAWDEATWQRVFERATALDLVPTLRLGLALQSWIEGRPWGAYPWGAWLAPPPQAVLEAAQRAMLIEPETELHRPWRAKIKPGWRGWLAYLRLTITMDGILPWYRWPGRIGNLAQRTLRSLWHAARHGDQALADRRRLLAWLREKNG